MRTDTIAAMKKAVELKPSMTAQQYAKLTHMSIGTVYRALEKIQAQAVPGTYPVQWVPAPEDGDMPLFVNTEGSLSARLDKLPPPRDPGKFSETQTLADAAAIAEEVITSGKLNLKLDLSSDLTEYRKELGRYAAHIVTMLWHVDALVGAPEWKIKAGLIPDITSKE